MSFLSIVLDYAPKMLFIVLASLLKFFDGIREPQFEVVAFVYFAEKVLPGTTKRMQGKAISVYKTFGALGYLLGSLQAPLMLKYLGYDGGFAAFMTLYIVCTLLSACLLPDIDEAAEDAKKSVVSTTTTNSQVSSITMWTVLMRKDL